MKKPDEETKRAIASIKSDHRWEKFRNWIVKNQNHNYSKLKAGTDLHEIAKAQGVQETLDDLLEQI